MSESPQSRPHPVHPLRTKARILLTSVFGPYAQDDEFGSRIDNPMELYQNQVTRVQGVFSLRMFHRSFGLMLIQANIDAPATLLDFPTRTRFIEELTTQAYDIIGISSIIPNFEKAREMCRLIRQHQPQATIVVGGHVANLEDLEQRLDADHVVRGEGVRWFRTFLGQDPAAPIKHPAVYSGFKTRIMGIDMKEDTGDTAAMLIPSVGCPMGCNFCSTSALFGGKGKSIHFFDTGDQLFDVMQDLEAKLKVKSFFVMDENFLFYKNRSLRLLELMKQHDKSWSLYIFSSAAIIKHYTMEQLLGLGVSWVWMGIEGKASRYEKLHGIDTKGLIDDLQANGIRVLGSSIIGLEDQTAENITEVIDHAISHRTVFHQFMLYTPTSGTPLHAELKAKGAMLTEEECSFADAHGQSRFNYRHPGIPAGMEGKFLLDAFTRDFTENGPSIARLFRTTLNGYRKHKHHPDERIRRRILNEAKGLADVYAGATWAIRRYYRHDPRMAREIGALLHDIYAEFGWKARLAAPLLGLVVAHKIRQEERRLADHVPHEPPVFYERNAAALALAQAPVAEPEGSLADALAAIRRPAHSAK
jgi:radical SAM superfamily enzyme YgiQ (UPF0313 family)